MKSDEYTRADLVNKPLTYEHSNVALSELQSVFWIVGPYYGSTWGFYVGIILWPRLQSFYGICVLLACQSYRL